MRTMNRVRKACEIMLLDQGLDPAQQVDLPSEFDGEPAPIDWDRVEKFLALLTDDQLQTFCAGDSEDIARIVEDGGVEGEYATQALETLFVSSIGFNPTHTRI